MRPSLTSTLVTLCIVAACTPQAGIGPAGSASRTQVTLPFNWPYRGREPIGTGQNGVVVTSDSRATRVGIDVLEAGGNAIDAAVAVGFALAVVLPEAGNIGGGGFMVIRKADGEIASLDFREMAPQSLTPDVYLDMDGLPTDDSREGILSVGVPGTVAGLAEAHRVYGSQPWKDLVEPAVDLAQNGFTVSARLHDGLTQRAARLQQYETTAQIFYPGGNPPRFGSTFSQPLLAQSLRIIGFEGKDAFYAGRIAEQIVQEMQRAGGLITYQDLISYTAKWRDPIVFTYRSRQVISMAPPSSGGVALAEILKILEGYDVESYGFNSPESIHLFVEAARRAFADRNYYLGDPDFVEIPVDELISDAHAVELRSSISLSRASASELYNRVPLLDEGINTTHYSIVDSEGTAVAVSYTINSSYGSGITVRGAGFLLNNEMDDFTVREGVANQYELVQSDKNLVGPGRRPLSSMSPTIVVDSAGALLMVLGSPGGGKIITAVSQVIVDVIDHGMDVRTAVDAPRVHHQLLPDEILFETYGFDGLVVGQLAEMGHEISPNAGYFGSVQLIIRWPDGTLRGAHDPRREGGRALGY